MEMNENKDNRIYEVGYLLAPTIAEEEVLAEADKLKSFAEGVGGVLIYQESPKAIDLAYEMSKVIDNKKHWFKNGYFGWFKFELEGGKIADIKKKLDEEKNLIRFILIKTVRESTQASKRPFGRREGGARRKEKTEEAAPINKEEIDKKIEEMVTV